MKKQNYKQVLSIILIILYVMPVPIYSNSNLPTINAEAAILLDAKTGTILYEKNAYNTYYPASITKIMTALLTIENMSPLDLITFSYEAIFSIEAGSSNIAINVGEQLTVDQALHAILLSSANEVTNGLAEAVGGSIENFAALMTSKAHSLGATSTNFVNPHGLHDANHYTTAYDMALIVQAIYDNPYFLEIMDTPTYQINSTNKTNETRYLSQQHSLMNIVRDSQRYRSDVIGGKTGYTSQAGNTLVTVARQGDIDLIVVILKGDINYYYNDTTKLLDYGFDSFSSLSLNTSGDILTVAPLYSIQSGKLFEVASCGITTLDDISVVVSSDVYKKDLTIDMNVASDLTLGTSIGDEVGSITYSHDGKKLATSPLIIAEINFLPAPQAYSFPSVSSSSPLFGGILQTIVGCFLICIVFAVVIKIHKHRQYLKHRQRLKYRGPLR
ncbi:MAG: hypothetical protein ATN35_07755 [Epulopiscium sp. Nele67-Bin004]|nr:MAG: hypothetical protein ATN35_07755 [Epulopiscium sp. Nele67-Bin004]